MTHHMTLVQKKTIIWLGFNYRNIYSQNQNIIIRINKNNDKSRNQLKTMDYNISNLFTGYF